MFIFDNIFEVIVLVCCLAIAYIARKNAGEFSARKNVENLSNAKIRERRMKRRRLLNTLIHYGDHINNNDRNKWRVRLL